MPLVLLAPAANATCPTTAVDCVPGGAPTLPIGPAPRYVAVGEFIELIKPYATFKEANERFSAPEPAQARAVLDSLQDFTRRTRVLRRVAMFRTQHGVSDYYLVPNAGEHVSVVRRVFVDDCCIYDYKDTDCCVPFPGFTFVWPDCIVMAHNYLSRATDGGCTLEVHYAAETARNCKVIDEMLVERYSAGILYGAAERLMMLPGWEWSRGDYAARAEGKFNEAVHRAGIDVARNFTAGGGGNAITKHRF